MTPEQWLEDGLLLKWPDGIATNQYAQVVALVVQLGGVLSSGGPRKYTRKEPTLSPSEPMPQAPQPPRKLADRIRDLLAQGEPLGPSEIARRLGCHPASVTAILKYLPGTKKVPGRTPNRMAWTLKENWIKPQADKPTKATGKLQKRGGVYDATELVNRVRQALEGGPISSGVIARNLGVHTHTVRKTLDTIGAHSKGQGPHTRWFLNGAAKTETQAGEASA